MASSKSTAITKNENPDKKPLNQLSFTVKQSGISINVPALSKHWIEQQTYTKYSSLPIKNGRLICEQTELDQWLIETDWFLQEMKWLLNLEHYRFWSYMVYDPGCIAAVGLFLQEATPFYVSITDLINTAEITTLPSTDVSSTTIVLIVQRIASLYEHCLDTILKIIFRLVIRCESETEWLTNDHLAELLYKNFLITIPIIFDILIAYGRTNLIQLQKLLKQIFSIDKKYKIDLQEALAQMKHSFDVIQEKLNENHMKTDFYDLTVFALDTASTIGILLDVLPVISVEIALEVHLEQCITNFYDVTVPALLKQLIIIDNESIVLDLLQQTRIELLGSFRAITNYYLEQILQNPAESILPAEHFLAILQIALSDSRFVIDYKTMYPVINDIEILQQACPDLDTFKSDFIQKAYKVTDENVQSTIFTKKSKMNDVSTLNDGNHDLDQLGAAAVAISKPSSNKIQMILDILPDLNNIVAENLLKRYHDNTELAISAFLEGNLDLKELQTKSDDQEPLISTLSESTSASASASSSTIKKTEKTKSTSARSNRTLSDFGLADTDNVIIKRSKGFPGQPKNLQTMLDDKSHVRSLKDRYQEYGYISDNEYDDEYDDSYDAFGETETKVQPKMRTGNLNNVIANELVENDDNYKDNDANDESDESDDGGEQTRNNIGGPSGGGGGGGGSGKSYYQDKSKDFCENPELIRERRAQNWSNKMQARGGGGQRKNVRPSDVVGKPKGQGQDTTTQNSRQKKETNKSTRGNHSRRQGAAWKRNTGMIPS